MKRILTSLVLVVSVYSFAQVSISGADNHTPKATLDVEAIQGKTNGILVPRVTKDVADNMPSPQGSAKIENSTLIYVTGNVSGQATKYATEVDAEGFYYFKDDKWVKLGGGSGAPFLGNTRGNIRVLPDKEVMVESTWKDDDFALVITYLSNTESPQLPDPTQNKNRIIAVVNTVGKSITFGGSTPLPNSTLRKNAGAMYMSNGERWYQIASF